MAHNKIIGWEKFLGLVEQVQKYSPWLSRQIAKRASEWPFWYSGLAIREWNERQAWVEMTPSIRNQVDGEISQGHMALGAELALRLVFLRLRQEFPFRYRILKFEGENHHPVDQAVDFRFGWSEAEWEQVRIGMARVEKFETDCAVASRLADGRSAGQYTFRVSFQMERMLASTRPTA